MTVWRALALTLLGLVSLPLAWPMVRLLSDPAAANPLLAPGRALALLGNSAGLVAGTLLLCGPAGVLLAFLLHRTDLPARRLLRGLLFLALFIPLPLVTSGWQAVLGSDGWLPLRVWNQPPGTEGLLSSWAPWGQGLGSAVWIHAMAGLPWVVLLAGQGLGWVERELEEAGLLVMPAWRVVAAISLPRARAAVSAALLWVAVQTAGEITVTDVSKCERRPRRFTLSSSSPKAAGPATR